MTRMFLPENDIKELEEWFNNNSKGFKHLYTYDWKEWTGNCYLKCWYDVLLPSGKILYSRWPNAGKIAGYEQGIKVRISTGKD